MSQEKKDTHENPKKESNPTKGWWQIFRSVFAAAFGVQSSKNRKQDLTDFKLWPYIIAAAIFIITFVAVLIGIVHLVLYLLV